MIVLREAPPGRCQSCRAPVAGWDLICASCGNDVRTRASMDSVAAPASAAPVRSMPAPIQAPRFPDGGTDMPRPAPGAARDWEAPGTSVGVSPGRPAPPVDRTPPNAEARAIASGVYVTGSVGLSVGSRYDLRVDGSRLLVLGPVNLNPTTVALERDLVGMGASSEGDRLVISQARSGRAGLILVFMSLKGGTAESTAAEILRAAQAAEPIGR